MDTLTYICTKLGLDPHARAPIEIPNIGREGLARLFHCVEFQVGVEVGVERGLFSEVLCQQNPGVRLFCVDAWRAYSGYRDHVSQTKLDGFYAEAQQRLAPYHCELIRGFSQEAAKQFADGSLDFVYLDAAHDLCSVVTDLQTWDRKVRVGGIVAGHDYIKAKLPSLMHVPQALHAWADAYQIHPWFVLGRQAKVEGEIRDDGRSWFYVKAPAASRGEKVIKQ